MALHNRSAGTLMADTGGASSTAKSSVYPVETLYAVFGSCTHQDGTVCVPSARSLELQFEVWALFSFDMLVTALLVYIGAITLETVTPPPLPATSLASEVQI